MTYFSRCGDAFPETEVADEIDGDQTERQLPLHGSEGLNTRCFMQLEHMTPSKHVSQTNW